MVWSIDHSSPGAAWTSWQKLRRKACRVLIIIHRSLVIFGHISLVCKVFINNMIGHQLVNGHSPNHRILLQGFDIKYDQSLVITDPLWKLSILKIQTNCHPWSSLIIILVIIIGGYDWSSQTDQSCFHWSLVTILVMNVILTNHGSIGHWSSNTDQSWFQANREQLFQAQYKRGLLPDK